MAYTSMDDYSRSIQVTNLNEILTQSASGSALSITQVLANAESYAKTIVMGYLNMQYQIAAEFAKNSPDASRNDFVLNAVIDIAVYRIFYTVNPRDIPEHRKSAYNLAISNMKGIMEGTFYCALPKLDPSISGGRRRIELYGNQKFISKPYDDPNLLNPETVTP